MTKTNKSYFIMLQALYFIVYWILQIMCMVYVLKIKKDKIVVAHNYNLFIHICTY